MTTQEAGRYGASLVAFILGAYLLVSLNLGAFAQVFRGSLGPEVFAPFVIAMIVLIAAIVLHPTTNLRRVIALVIVVVGVITLLSYQLARISGGMSLGRDLNIMSQSVLRWDAVTITLVLAAWLVVRRRRPVTYILLVAVALVGFLGFFLLIVGLPSLISSIVITVVGLVIAVGIAWAAAAISRRHDANAVHTPPMSASYAPVQGAPAGAPHVSTQTADPYAVPPAGSVPPVPPVVPPTR